VSVKAITFAAPPGSYDRVIDEEDVLARLIVTEFVTLDGVMEAPGGEPTHPHAAWVGAYHDEGTIEYKLNETLEAESHLLGRVTYESFADAWPRREGPFAEKINAMPKYVVSSTLRDPEWNDTHVLAGDPVPAVAKLKDETDGPILVAGSATLVHAVIENNLIDELRLMVFPVAIGGSLGCSPSRGGRRPAS
jgi:dihydrofolate reductase